MSALQSLMTLRTRALTALAKLAWFPPLLCRVSLGLIFAPSGWGKIHNLEKVTGYFASLGIPAPGLNAVLASVTELVCGVLIAIGLLSRLNAVPLIVTMIVALYTAKASEIHGIAELAGTAEFVYIIMLVVVAVSGPGAVSVDHLLERRLVKQEKKAAAT